MTDHDPGDEHHDKQERRTRHFTRDDMRERPNVVMAAARLGGAAIVQDGKALTYISIPDEDMPCPCCGRPQDLE